MTTKPSWPDFLKIVAQYNPTASKYLETAREADGPVKDFYEELAKLDFPPDSPIDLNGLIIFSDHPVLDRSAWRQLSKQVHDHIEALP